MSELFDPDLTEPSLEWRDGAPLSTEFDDVYFSNSGGPEETRHVFLTGNGLPQRWSGRTHFVIGETGFGTGLNFIETWRAWRSDPESCTRLHFLSVEKHPISRELLSRALRAHPERELVDDLIAKYPVRCPGFHRVEFESGRVVLTLLFGDVLTMLSRIGNGAGRTVDAWFLDGFTPSRNPEMWSIDVFREIARLSRTGASFATFTSAGFVRRGLEQVGFDVRKCKGFRHKREMAHGEFKTVSGCDESSKPWHRWPAAPTATQALVVGGGLAGTATARALSLRGFDVTLLERHDDIATQASGSPAGIYHADLMRECTPRERLFTGAVGFTARRLQSYFDGTLDVAGAPCGAVHPVTSAKRAQHHRDVTERRAVFPEFVEWLSPDEASDVAGLAIEQPALFYPQAGWVCPADVCRANIESGHEVRVRTGTHVAGLERVGDRWVATNDEGDVVGEAPIVVIATAGDALHLPIVNWLPLRQLRGQITRVEATAASDRLRSVVYYEGYATPSHDGFHTLGATFDHDSVDVTVRDEDHVANLDRLCEGFPALHSSLATRSARRVGRAALRAVCPDHLPMIGPVPDEARFRRQYDGLRFGRSIDEQSPAPVLPGLYVSVGHGSRGIVSSQFGAEIIASQIAGDPMPTERGIVDALTPGRFLVRSLARGGGDGHAEADEDDG